MHASALSETAGQSGFVNGLIAVASRLVRLLELETSFLRDMRPGAIRELQEEKMRLVRGYESMASDWLFIPNITRAIHADVRYMLWIMDAVDGADHLLEEMGVKPAI